MSTEDATKLESPTQAQAETPTETLKTKVFELAQDPETGEAKRYRLEDAWKFETPKMQYSKMRSGEKAIEQKRRETQSYENTDIGREIIKNPVNTNPLLVELLGKENIKVTNDDVIIRKGNQIIIRKLNSDKKTYRTEHAVLSESGNEITAKSKFKNIKSGWNYTYEKTPLVEQQEIQEEFIPSVNIFGKEVKKGDEVKYARDLVVTQTTKKGDEQFITVKNKNNNKEYKLPVASLSLITAVGDLEQYASTSEEDAQPSLQTIGVSQIRRGIQSERIEPIEKGIKSLEQYKKDLHEMAQQDLMTTEIEQGIASTEKKIQKAEQVLTEIKEKQKPQEENLENLVAKGKELGVETTAIEEHLTETQEKKPAANEFSEMTTSTTEHGAVEVEWNNPVAAQKTETLTDKLKTQPEMLKKKYEETPAQLVAEARDAYLALYAKSFKEKGAFKRGLLNIGHATGFLKKDSEKFLNTEAKAAKKKYDDLKNGLEQAMVDRLKAQGKSDEQIITVMKRYRKVVLGIDNLEQESAILKKAQEEAFTGSKVEKMLQKKIEWYKNLDPIKKRLLSIGIGTASGLATGGISSAATWLGFLGAYAVRYTAGTGAGWIAGWAVEKFWKSGKGGVYEQKLEELKKSYLAGEITPAKYQQLKEGLELLENKATTIKSAITAGAAFGAAAEADSLTAGVTEKIEGKLGFHKEVPVPQSQPITIDIEKYKVDVPPDQFITEPHAPGELPTTISNAEVLAPATETTTAHSFDNSVGGSVKNKFSFDFTPITETTADSQIDFSAANNYDSRVIENPHISTETTIDFSAANTYDARVIDNPNIETDSTKINPISIFENTTESINQKMQSFIATEFPSNTALWEPLKVVNATTFVTQPESNIEAPFMQIYKDLSAAAKTVPPLATENVETYVQRLINQGVDLNQNK